ncbi:MAG: AzlD domain-containing protein [Tateyamaria sp.]|jgi:branched-subunit amino acid transport protein|nr:AzlD domain-containing protein [Tateyamaria sp.]MBT6267468.1 AzlD domain-containing protein [Tateyamaria sp.]MBT7447682.1 AzlD domain-containing protein [Tateyamaria sp.]
MNIDKDSLWIIILTLGIGSFLLRFSFLGLVGDRQFSPRLLRHLRYTAVAIIPALVAPIVVYPNGSGSLEPIRLITALVTIGVGIWTKNMIIAIIAGMTTLFTMLYVII